MSRTGTPSKAWINRTKRLFTGKRWMSERFPYTHQLVALWRKGYSSEQAADLLAKLANHDVGEVYSIDTFIHDFFGRPE